MTTIAWDGKCLAADRRHCSGSAIHYDAPKIVTIENQDGSATHYANTGPAAWLQAWIEWDQAGAEAGKGMPVNTLDGYQGGIVRLQDGECLMLDPRIPYWTTAGERWAWGSGADFALAAMACGKTAAEAVEIAAMFDPMTGGPIDVVGVSWAAVVPHEPILLGKDGPHDAARCLCGGCARRRYDIAKASAHLPPYFEPEEPAKTSRTITKPSKVENWLNSGQMVWDTECAGLLVDGTGCGHCLRCNREWFGLLREHGGARDAKTLVITVEPIKPAVAVQDDYGDLFGGFEQEDCVSAQSWHHASMDGTVTTYEFIVLKTKLHALKIDAVNDLRRLLAEHLLSFASGSTIMWRVRPGVEEYQHVGRGPLTWFGYARLCVLPPLKPVAPEVDLTQAMRQMDLEAWCIAYNEAQSKYDMKRVRDLDDQLRSITFPDGCELIAHAPDAEHNYWRREIICPEGVAEKSPTT